MILHDQAIGQHSPYAARPTDDQVLAHRHASSYLTLAWAMHGVGLYGGGDDDEEGGEVDAYACVVCFCPN